MVEPIKNKESINRVRRYLSDKPRNLLLFDMATQTGIGMKNILLLRVQDLKKINIGECIQGFSDRDKKTGYMTQTLYDTFVHYIKMKEPDESEFLFASRKGKKPLGLSAVSSMIQSWFKELGIEGLSGARSLRKTWKVHFRSTSQVELPIGKEDEAPFLKPLDRLPLKEKVYKELTKAIVSGRFVPGERLLEERIAKQMNVSRMPVREALQRLRETGFVEPALNIGIVVKKISIAELNEITKIRLLLEINVAKEAAICRKERTVEKLEKTHGDLIRAIDSNDIDLMLKLNNKFHMTFYRDVNMPILQKMIEDLWDRISPYLHILLREGDKVASSKDVIRDHFGMIEGVRKKDPKIVCHWLKADLTEGQYMVENLLKKWDVE